MPVSPKTLVLSLEDLYNLGAFYPKNIILSYINVNSIRNKLDDLKLLWTSYATPKPNWMKHSRRSNLQ